MWGQLEDNQNSPRGLPWRIEQRCCLSLEQHLFDYTTGNFGVSNRLRMKA